jgi:hypothetical protein
MPAASRVLVTPAPGFKVRNPADPRQHIAAGGEVMLMSAALKRLADVGDVTIAPEPSASDGLPLPPPKSATPRKKD